MEMLGVSMRLIMWVGIMAAPTSGGIFSPARLAPLPFSISAGDLQLAGEVTPRGIFQDSSLPGLYDSVARERSRYLTYRASTVYTIDVLVGLFSAFAVAPFLATIDQVVTEKASDAALSTPSAFKDNLMAYILTPLPALSRPGFLLILAVYCSTYVVVNLISSYCELRLLNPFWLKLFGGTLANSTLGMMKDRYFAKMFGSDASAHFPILSIVILLLRDLLTMGSGFNFPQPVASILLSRHIVKTEVWANRAAQLLVPLFSQLVVTPLHLLALDIYYRPNEELMGRVLFMDKILVSTLLIRMARVLCAYSIAGVMNTYCKQALRDVFVPPDTPAVEAPKKSQSPV